MRVLQLCYKLPFPPNDGGAFSLYNFAKSLLKTEEIDLYVLAMKQKKNKDSAFLIPDSFKIQTNFKYVEIDNRIKPIKAIMSCFKKTSYFIDRFYSKEFEITLIETIKKNPFDIIQLEHTYLGVYLETIKKYFNGIVILRAQNVEYLLWEGYLESRKLFFPIRLYMKIMTRRLENMEFHLINQIDGLICLSEEDRLQFMRMNPNVENAVIPVGFDEEQIHQYFPTEESLCIYHLGSMDWRPNIQGVEWFLNDVLPLLREMNQEVKVYLAGKNMSSRFTKISKHNVIIDGEIKNAIEYLSDKPILIVPLLTGGGIRVKIIEALALGKVIISTSIGAEGILRLKHGENILIADTPEHFAKSINECLNSPELRQKLRQNGQKLYETQYKLTIIGKETKLFYEKILCK